MLKTDQYGKTSYVAVEYQNEKKLKPLGKAPNALKDGKAFQLVSFKANHVEKILDIRCETLSNPHPDPNPELNSYMKVCFERASCTTPSSYQGRDNRHL